MSTLRRRPWPRQWQRFGRIDALFNVAGGSGRRFGDGPVHEMTLDGWERTMALNARTHVTTSRAVLRRMLGQAPDADGSRGAILNMASILAFVPAAVAVPDPRLCRVQGRHRDA